jgi:hypothetical protein
MTLRARILGLALLALLWPRGAAAAREVSVSLPDFIRQMRDFMPAEGSNGYVVPSAEDRQAFATAARALLAGDVARAEAALGNYPGFEVLDLRDPTSGAYLALAEKPPLTRGWGFFLFARAPSRPAMVLEMPHPLADRDSELAGAEAATRLHPAAVLFAGAHRYADALRRSDVAHTPQSVFETVHEVLLGAGRVMIQLHGFSATGHVGYPELVMSTGTVAPDAAAKDLCARIVTSGIDCSLFDGSAYLDLGAQDNVQGAAMRAAPGGGGQFLHLETAETIRDQPERLALVVDALAARWPASPSAGGCDVVPSATPPAWLIAAIGLTLARARRGVRSRLHQGE